MRRQSFRCENKNEMGTARKAWLDFIPEEGEKPGKTGIPLHPAVGIEMIRCNAQ